MARPPSENQRQELWRLPTPEVPASSRASGGSRPYVGTELELFARAANWKRYFASRIRPFVAGRVLEVGAGVGGTTRQLGGGPERSWVCLEPDASLARQLVEALEQQPLPVPHSVVVGTTADLNTAERFNTILYIDVVEHIEDDKTELARAASLLVPGGMLVVLAPAHEWLYTPFDRAIGHVRRYRRSTIRRITPAGTDLIRCRYLDSVGMLASLANKLWLRSSMPSERQIRVWDRFMVPLSRLVDRMVAFQVGKSILAIWRKWPNDRSASAPGPCVSKGRPATP